MAIIIGRKMTETDRNKLNAAAERFCKKWNLDIGCLSALEIAQDAAETAQYPEQASDMRRDWNARVKRALGGYTTWGYGYVGHSAQ